ITAPRVTASSTARQWKQTSAASSFSPRQEGQSMGGPAYPRPSGMMDSPAGAAGGLMGDAGEGLVDAEDRFQQWMAEREQEKQRHGVAPADLLRSEERRVGK